MGTNASYFIPREVAKHHDVLVIEGPSYEAEEGLTVTNREGLEIRTVNETQFDKRVSGISKHIDAFQPDIIHIFYHHQALRLGKALRKTYSGKVKFLLDIRTPLLEENPRQRLRVQFRAILLQNAFDMIATHSPYSVKTIFPLCWIPVRELSYGVDAAAFKRKTLPMNEKTIDLVYTGAIAKKRNIDQILLSFKSLLQKTEAQNYDFKLHFYGAGNRLDEIQRLAEEMQLNNYTVFHGLIEQTKLANILHKHTIGIGYVPFGIYKQAPALKTLEYMCAGLAVLASDTQPTKDLLKQGFQLTPYDNSQEGFSKGILEICKNGLSKKSADANFELINKFDWRHIVEDTLLKIYKELLGR